MSGGIFSQTVCISPKQSAWIFQYLWAPQGTAFTLYLQISCSSHSLLLSESGCCNKYTKYYQQEAAFGECGYSIMNMDPPPQNLFINLHLVRGTNSVYPWKTSNFHISRCRAATAGQLSCVTMQCHALAIMCRESTWPTDWAHWQGSALTSSGPTCPTGHYGRFHHC